MGCSRQPGRSEAQAPHAALSDVQPPTERHTVLTTWAHTLGRQRRGSPAWHWPWGHPCTDGVMEGVWDRALEELIRDPPADLAQRPAAHRVVRAALAESGRDNATAVVVEIDSAT